MGVGKSVNHASTDVRLVTKNYLTTKKIYLVKQSRRKIEKSAKDLKNATSGLKI